MTRPRRSSALNREGNAVISVIPISTGQATAVAVSTEDLRAHLAGAAMETSDREEGRLEATSILAPTGAQCGEEVQTPDLVLAGVGAAACHRNIFTRRSLQEGVT